VRGGGHEVAGLQPGHGRISCDLETLIYSSPEALVVTDIDGPTTVF
jgi:hypothetical protein